MENFNYNRSRSHGNNNNGQMMQQQMEKYYGGAPPTRSYSVSYAQAHNNNNNNNNNNKKDLKKGGKSMSSRACSISKSLRFASDPEFQRKKRVASYKMYSVEGKVKGSFRKSFRWLKDRYCQVLYGWW